MGICIVGTGSAVKAGGARCQAGLLILLGSSPKVSLSLCHSFKRSLVWTVVWEMGWYGADDVTVRKT